MITEVTPTGAPTQDGITIVREGGLDINGTLVFVDRYLVHLAAAPTGKVYVTVSAACSPLNRRTARASPSGPSARPVPAAATRSCSRAAPRRRRRPTSTGRSSSNGVATWVPNRTLVLVFDASNWSQDQTVWLTAVDDQLAEGPRVGDDQPQRHRPTTVDPPSERAVLRQRRRAQRRGHGARQRPGRPRHHAARQRPATRTPRRS